MRSKHTESDRFSRPTNSSKILAQLMNRHEVPFGLRHLLAFDLKEAVVHPVIRHNRRVEGATRLRDLVLVMGKDEIDAAAVDVEDLAEIFPRHRRAFDVPAGTAGRSDAGGRRPGGLAGL